MYVHIVSPKINSLKPRRDEQCSEIQTPNPIKTTTSCDCRAHVFSQWA
jgi:hypothetical protein